MNGHCSLCSAPDTRDCECSRPRSVTLTLQLGDTFSGTDADLTAELARCLRVLAGDIQKGRVDDLEGLPARDRDGHTIGLLEVHTGEPRTFAGLQVVADQRIPDGAVAVAQPGIVNVVSFLALMQGGGGLMSKAPKYMGEKFSRLMGDEPQILDHERESLVTAWCEKWRGHL